MYSLSLIHIFPLDGLEYTTDFVCVKAGGDLRVRECVRRKFLTKPLTVKLLDDSCLLYTSPAGWRRR